MTYKQAAAAGAQVRKGEKGTPVQYCKFSQEQDKLDDQGRPVRENRLNHPEAVFMGGVCAIPRAALVQVPTKASCPRSVCRARTGGWGCCLA